MAESVFDLLRRIKFMNTMWVANGHIDGQNTHNVSATVSIKREHWDDVGNWLWINNEVYNGISVLPYDGGTYKQAPFESISKYKYDKMIEKLKKVNLTEVFETDDNTDLQGELACSGGSCELK